MFFKFVPKIITKLIVKPKHIYFNKIVQFHTSNSHGAIPPLVWLIAKPITKLGAIIAGRGFRKWWSSLPKIKRDIFLAHLKRHQIRYAGGFGLTSFTCYIYYDSHIQETPLTKRKRFILFSNEQLTEIEKLEKAQLFTIYEENVMDFYTPQVNRAMRVANRLFAANKEIPEVHKINWKLTVIDEKIINAVAFPSGDLVVFSGLLEFVENDDELAIIMAHEMSHAVLQHAAEEISHSRLLDIISISLALIVWAILPTDLTAAITQVVADRLLRFTLELPYSRDLEKEADHVGLMFAAKACFDVRYSPLFWRRMGENNQELIPEILSTHPASETRAQDLESLLPAALRLRKECDCYELPAHLTNTPRSYLNGVSYLPRQDTENIFLIWFGENYPLVYFKCLETLVFHHPKADVLIFSNELDENLVEPFWKKGYQNVRVVRFNLTILGRDKPGFDFVIKATKLLRNETLLVFQGKIQLTNVHLSDFLRYLLVYTYGDFYLDSDSFVVKNFLKFKNSISVTENYRYNYSTKVCSTDKIKNFKCLSNCMFHFEQYHPFMRDALNHYDLWWSKYQVYGPGGASMLMSLVERNFNKINFYKSEEFVCQSKIRSSRKKSNSTNEIVEYAMKNCYTLQILGAGKFNFSIDNFNETPMAKIYGKSRIF
ncbi:unnamed protein product [Brachionus calyciflorus]|uniref:Metalloendopeptidase OMA1, mitochondrial n=1 Tax=Brachionus calyciflorus TaxID=104777 RepID=A0A814CX95_9BILA|nr:unnamed protein product [Brachionus calyciflorus]